MFRQFEVGRSRQLRLRLAGLCQVAAAISGHFPGNKQRCATRASTVDVAAEERCARWRGLVGSVVTYANPLICRVSWPAGPVDSARRRSRSRLAGNRAARVGEPDPERAEAGPGVALTSRYKRLQLNKLRLTVDIRILIDDTKIITYYPRLVIAPGALGGGTRHIGGRTG